MNLESPVASMGSRQRLFDSSWFCGTKNGAPRGRRIIHGEVDEEKEFQYANPHCLSSYYSVFVARLTIMVMLAILIGMLTILTWHFTRVYTTKSINNLAYSLRYELLQRPILRMWNILNSTAEITTAQVKLSEYVIRQHENPMSQAKEAELYETMRNITWALFASRKALSAITISYKNGFVQAFHRDHRNNNTFYIYSDIVNSTSEKSHKATDPESLDEGWRIHGNSSEIWYREPLDPVTGETTGEQKPIPPDDLINIARISEIPDGVASWHVTVGKLTNSPMLSAALPVRDSPNGSIVAVVGVTTELYSVGQLMKELMEFHSGYMYLTSREGYLLATSSNTPLLRNASGGPNLMMAVDSEDRMIRLGAKWLEGGSGNEFQRNDEVHAENVRLGHHQYYIDSFFLKLKRLPLVGVIIIPRKYVMGKVDQRALTTLVILISASLCILVIGCVCILILTSGVSKEMNLRAELITQLDARRQAEASSNYKSQFLANMSHELRTPMAAVIGLLDILVCDDCLTNEQYATVTQIRKCSAALLGLLNNILDLSKVESGKLVLEQAEFDLGRELEGLVDMFSVQCMKHNVEIVLDLSDDMPKLVLGDSARVIQIFANLISNSIKFTSSGHVILRGWCESSNSATYSEKLPLDQKSQSVFRTNTKKQPDHAKGNIKSGNKTTLWFEVDDTGCGIDPSKWESVFESFEQADPSTTRTYGGTGLGLCIVRTLAWQVKKMGGDIKVVKKDGPGTLMQLHLVLNAPLDCALYGGDMEFTKHSLTVLLALNGTMGRSIISCWLRRNGVYTWEASEWNELTQILQEVFTSNNRIPNSGFKIECSTWESSRDGQVDTSGISKTVIVLDIGLLDLSTNIWKEQLKFLDKYHAKAKFAWVLNHDACNAIKMELRQKGHLVMVNKPLYKAKMIHILEAAIKESNLELQRKGGHPSRISTVDADLHECLEIDPFHSEVTSSDDSDVSDGGSTNLKGHAVYQAGEKPVQQIARYHSPQSNGLNNSSVELIQVNSTENKLNLKADSPQIRRTNFDIEGSSHLSYRGRISASTELKSVLNEHQMSGSGLRQQGRVDSIKVASGQRSLEGLCILLVEDTPILQKVATIMLEKMGAIVVSVGDGLQAVEALKCLSGADCRRWELLSQVGATMSQTPFSEFPDFDLILMDCQMPNMDGYEATKAIRKMEEGCEVHIPIVALTAHAMSSDEAKCLEVGMDAYLTKPIDCKLMTSTILSLTKSKRMV